MKLMKIDLDKVPGIKEQAAMSAEEFVEKTRRVFAESWPAGTFTADELLKCLNVLVVAAEPAMQHYPPIAGMIKAIARDLLEVAEGVERMNEASGLPN